MLQQCHRDNIDFAILDVMKEEAFVLPEQNIDLVVVGDIIYDNVLTESFCRVG